MVAIRPRITLAIGLLLIVSVACSTPVASSPPTTGAPSSSGGTSGAPETPPPAAKITVGLATVSALQWPYYVAADQGFYRDVNLEVELLVTESNTKAVQGLVAGSLNVAAGSPDAAIRAIAEGSDLVVTGSVMNRPIYTQVAQPGLTSYDGLRGQRVGVSGIKSMDGLWMRQLLEKHGLDPDKDVEIVEIGGTSQRLAALKSKGVAAALLTQPADFQALREGFVDLGKSTEIAGEIIWSGYTVRRDWAQANEEVLVRFLAVQRQAAKWLYDPANKAEALRILQENTKSELLDAQATYDLWITEKALAPRGEATESSVQTMIDSLKAIGGLSKALTVDEILDTSFMAQAAKIVP